ncbi:hypothetical protein ScPMuIL_003221 [Solemya velum]
MFGLNLSKTVLCALLVCLVLIGQLTEEHNGYQCTGLKIPTSHFVATGIKSGTFVSINSTIWHSTLPIIDGRDSDTATEISRRCFIRVLFVFWLIQLIADIIPLQSRISNQAGCAESVVFYVYFAVLVAVFLLHCVAEKKPQTEYTKKPCPEGSSGIFSQIIFWWLTPLVLTAYRKTIGLDDLWDQTDRLKSKNVVPVLDAAWMKEKTKCKIRFVLFHVERIRLSEKTPLLKEKSGHSSEDVLFRGPGKSDSPIKPSLYKVLIKTYGFYWLGTVALKLVSDSAWFIQPVVVEYLVYLIGKKNSGQDPGWMTYGSAVLLVVSSIMVLFIFHTAFHQLQVLGLKIKVGLISLIYKKAISISPTARQFTSVGEIVNLMSVDCQRVQDGFQNSFNIVSFFFMVTIATYQMWTLMGISAMGTLGFIVTFAPVGATLAATQNSLQQKILKLKGTRMKVLHEVIAGIKVLKMYTWEIPFQNKICQIRSDEMKHLVKIATIIAVFNLFAFHGSFMIFYFTILIYVLNLPTHYLDAQKTYAALTLANVLRNPIGLTPFLINGITQAYVSIGRIQTFLWNEDIDPDNVEFVKTSDYGISVVNGTFTWNRSQDVSTLRGVNLSVKEGS